MTAKTRRHQVPNPKQCDLRVGISQTGNALLLFELELIHIVYAERDVITELGITTGNYFFIVLKLDNLFTYLLIGILIHFS